MATVPRLSGATVDPQRLQGGEQRAFDHGSQAIAQGAQAVAGAVNEIAQAEIAKHDNNALMAFETELANTEHALVNEDLYSRKGADAISAPQTLWRDWEQRVGGAIDRLPSRLRPAAERIAETRRQDTQRTVTNYVMRESESYAQAQEDGLIASAAQTASLNYMDPQRVETEVARARLAANAKADRLGLDGMARSSLIRQADSAIYQTAIERMLVDDPAHAQAYFETWGDRLTPESRQTVRNALQPSMLDYAGRAIGDSYLRGFAVEDDDPATVVDAIIGLESGGRADATNPDSSATGAGQFIESTWLQVVRSHRPDLLAGKTRDEVLALRLDPALSREMTAAYAEDNARHLRAKGVEATAANIYAAHHFGPEGGVRFANAADDAPVSEFLTEGQINANGYLRGLTKAEVVANWQRRGLPGGGVEPATVRRGASEPEILAAIDANVRDHRVREAAKRRVSEQFRLRDAGDTQADRELSEAVNLAVENAAPTSGLSLRELLTPDQYARAAAKGWIPALESRWLQRRTGEPEVSSPDTVMALEETIYRAALGREINQDALRKLNPYDPTLRLTPQDRKRFADAQLSMLSGDPEKMADVASEAEINGIITRYTVDTLGIPEGQIGKPTDRGRKAWQFQVEMRTWADEFARENKRKPTYTEVLAQADLLTLRGTVQTPGFWGTKDRPFNVRDLGIPNAQLQQIEEALRMEGKPVTAENIADKWRRFGGGGQ